MDKFIVRFSIFALNAYILIVLILALNGIDISLYDYLFTDSLLFGVVLTTLILKQGKYHCRWAKALCFNLILTPLVNFFDCKYGLFDTIEEYIYFVCILMLLTILITIYLAINNFRRVKRLKRK